MQPATFPATAVERHAPALADGPANTGPVSTGPAALPTLGVLVRVWPKLSETFILEEVLGLERQGVPLRIYSLAPAGDEVRHDAVLRVRAPHREVPPASLRCAFGLALAHLRSLVAAPAAWLGALRLALADGGAGLGAFARAGWLADRLRRDGVTHLHAHFIAEPADVAQLTAAAAGVPFSISAHAKDIYTSREHDLRRRLQAARFTVTCTEHNLRTLAAVAPGAALHRMYHGIDHAVFHPQQRDTAAGDSAAPLLLAVGRLRAKKGLDTLIDACAVLRQRGRAFRCEIVGYGEEREALRERIRALGLEDCFTLPGKLAREQVIARYATAAVFVQPSRITADGDRDGIPNVLLEAMSMGVPVVASEVSGIPELVADRHNGLLVPADDPRALADAVARLLDDPALAARLAAAGRQTVTERFDNDRNLSQLTRLLQTCHACREQRAA